MEIITRFLNVIEDTIIFTSSFDILQSTLLLNDFVSTLHGLDVNHANYYIRAHSKQNENYEEIYPNILLGDWCTVHH